MAGDWIKMRSDLFTHPKVVRISSALKADTLRTVGGLMSAWCLFDAHSEDGVLDGYNADTLDEQLRWPGFAAAMIAVGWLLADDQKLVLPRFDTHNGQSAKRRAQDSDRKREVRKQSASQADTLRTREEKRREEPKVGNTSTRTDTEVKASDASARDCVLAVVALRKLGMMDVHPARPELLDLVARGTTLEQMCLTAAELALKKAGMLDDVDLHPELLQMFASGATQAQLMLTNEQHAHLRSCVPALPYLAKTLIGRAADAARNGDSYDRNANGHAQRGTNPGSDSAAGRAERARRAGDARDAANGDDFADL